MKTDLISIYQFIYYLYKFKSSTQSRDNDSWKSGNYLITIKDFENLHNLSRDGKLETIKDFGNIHSLLENLSQSEILCSENLLQSEILCSSNNFL